jgi:SprT protein
MTFHTILFSMQARQNLQEGLKPYLPENSLGQIMQWLDGHPVHLRITRGRASKLGDYRPPQKDQVHRISVNGNLNPYEFLITLTHEIAHLAVWEKYRKKVRPHGPAWKNQFASMLGELVNKDIFPNDIESIIHRQVANPKASSKSDTELARALNIHNPVKEGVFLEELPIGAYFYLPDGRKFQKQEKLRKWYRCISQDNRRPYRISPVARVVPADI